MNVEDLPRSAYADKDEPLSWSVQTGFLSASPYLMGLSWERRVWLHTRIIDLCPALLVFCAFIPPFRSKTQSFRLLRLLRIFRNEPKGAFGPHAAIEEQRDP